MSALKIGLRIGGVAFSAALAFALYYGWSSVDALIRMLPNPPRGVVFDLKIPIAVILGVLALSLANWIWSKTVGRFDP